MDGGRGEGRITFEARQFEDGQNAFRSSADGKISFFMKKKKNKKRVKSAHLKVKERRRGEGKERRKKGRRNTVVRYGECVNDRKGVNATL